MNKQTRKIWVAGVIMAVSVVLLAGGAAAGVVGSGSFGLGRTIDCLKVAVDVQEGQTLREALIEKGIDPDSFVKEQYAVRKEAMDQLVSEGKMSPEQAEACLVNLEANLNAKLDSTAGCKQQGQGRGLGQGIGGKQMRRGCGR